MTAEILREPGIVLGRIPVADLALLVVAAGAGLSIARGLATERRELARVAPLFVALLGGTGAVWVRAHGGLAGIGAQVGVAAIVAALVGCYFALARGTGASAAPGLYPPDHGYLGGRSLLHGPGRGHLAIALLLAAVLLAWHLTTFAGSTLVWESPVTAGFGEAFYAGKSPLAYALGTLVWNDGLVSNGNASLLYGAPTYALLTCAGFSTLSLRVCATLAAFFLVVALWIFARRHYGPAAGAATAVAAALSTYILFYGRYGTSLAATLLTCAVAALAVGELVGLEHPSWWHGLVAGLALFVATLHYSPGRLVAVVLLASLVPSLFKALRERRRRSLAAFAVLASVGAAVLLTQRAAGGQRLFLHARGEQLFTILRQTDYIRDYLARDSPAFNAFTRWATGAGLMRSVRSSVERDRAKDATPHRLSFAEGVEVTFKVLAETVPECNRLLSPFELTNASQQSIFDDPPAIKPYFAPLAAFTLLGFATSVRRLWQWRHAVLLAWFGVTVISVLLTTRFDAHRIALVAVPLCVWTALGVVEAGHAVGRLGLWNLARSALAWMLAALLLVGTGSVALRQNPDNGVPRRVLAALDRVSGPVVVGALIDHRQRAWIELGLLERPRRNRQSEGRLLAADLREAPTEGDGILSPELLGRFRALCANATVVLTPADAYRVAADQMRAFGLSVTEAHDAGVSLWLIRSRPS